MAAEYFTHKTATGERFDLLAYRYYGDAGRMGPIVRANRATLLGALFDAWRGTAADPHLVAEPHLPLVFTRPATLRIPVIEEPSIAPDQLPPWKR